jgi:hypothetical protein
VPTQQDIPRLLALRETRRRGGLARNQNAALTEIERRFQQIAEPAAAMATGMLAEPVSGIVGMAALPFGADVAANAVRNTQQGLTYQPRTEAGQQGMQALQGFMQPIAETVSRQTDIASKVLAGNAGFDVNTPGGQFLTGMLPALAASAPGFTAARAIPGRRLEMGDIGAGGVGSRQRGAVGGVKATPPDAALQLDSLPGFKEGKWAAFNVGPARIEIMDIGEGVKIGSSKIKDETSRGRGFGVAAYEDLIAKAKSQGKKFIESDETVNMDAARVYNSLERKGYKITKDPTAKIMNSKFGNNPEDFWSADGDKAPFRIEIDEAAADNSSKIRRLYHASNVEFDKFDPARVGDRMTALGLGHYLTPNKVKANQYGSKLMEFDVDTKDVLDFSNLTPVQRGEISAELLKQVPTDRLAGFMQPTYKVLSPDDAGDRAFTKLQKQTDSYYHDRAKAIMLDGQEVPENIAQDMGIKPGDIVVRYVDSSKAGLENATPENILALMQEFDQTIPKKLGYKGASYGDEFAIYDPDLAVKVK